MSRSLARRVMMFVRYYQKGFRCDAVSAEQSWRTESHFLSMVVTEDFCGLIAAQQIFHISGITQKNAPCEQEAQTTKDAGDIGTTAVNGTIGARKTQRVS